MTFGCIEKTKRPKVASLSEFDILEVYNPKYDKVPCQNTVDAHKCTTGRTLTAVMI